MFSRITILFFIVLSLSSCAPTYLYHSPKSNCSEKDQSSCSKTYIEKDHGYSLGFVEIDDKGWFRDRGQLSAFINELQKPENQNVLLLVFAHGWKHNADNNDRDLNRMRSTLKHLVEFEQQTSNPRKVMGLYLGWRGLSVTFPLIKELSFWERKSVAHNAGETANEVFTRLQLIMDKKRALADNKNISSYVVIGHSFGGALVYSAMRPIILSRLSQQKYSYENKLKHQANTDLVVLLNPAFEAARVKELREVFKNTKAAPYLIVLTADNDNATRKAFPAGRHLSTFFDKYSKNQKKADRKTIGHYKPFFTHELKDVGAKAGNGCGKKNSRYMRELDLFTDNGHVDQWLHDYATKGHKLLLQDSSINHISHDTSPDNPIQIIQVQDRDILDKHSNIICDDLVDLIRTYIIFNSRYK